MKTFFLFLIVFIISFSHLFSQTRNNGTARKTEDKTDVDRSPVKEVKSTPPPIVDREPRTRPPDPPGRTPNNNNMNLTPPPRRNVNPPSTVQTPPTFIEYIPIPYYYNPDPVEPIYTQPIATPPPPPITKYDYKNLGLQQFKDEDYYNALESFQTALAIDTLQYSLYYNIGLTEIEIGRYDDAIYYLTMFIDKVIENRMGFYQRGLAYFYAGDRDSALDDFLVADQYKVVEAKVMLKRFYNYY